MPAAQPERLPLNEPEHVARESKEEAFLRLCQPRVNKALDAIRLIGNLSNRGGYTYEPEDVVAILSSLRVAIDETEMRFRINSPRRDFQLRR